MHANEPTESRLINDPNQEIADAAWRAEVASRVCSYHARRKRRHAGENSPALDFGPEDQSPQASGPAAEAQNAARNTSRNPIRDTVRTPIRNASSNAIDTNYYRRLNAESMAQDSSVAQGQAVAAEVQETGVAEESNAMNEAISESESADSVLDSLIDREAVVQDPALDLELRPSIAADSLLDRYCISEPEPEPEPKQPAVPAQGNLIVFPRAVLEPPLLPLPSRDELAEPMNRRPRILEVPEDIMPVVQGSLFPEIRLDGDVEEGASSREPEIEVPLRVAPASARLMAGLTDSGVVMAASLLFAGMSCRALPGIPHAKLFWMILGAVTVLLWAIYHHLFLLYAGRTLGMSMRGIRLSTFDGQPPQWKQRRRRAHFMLISFAAVTLGFLWALADQDALCWHDRISRTFPTTE